LDAAEVLFHAPRIQAVGMDAIREAAGMALKQIHGLFATKEELVIAVLRRRDQRWRASLADHVESHDDPRERVLSVFDWLEQWFAEPGFRGCAWINAYGELGGISPPVLAEVRAHKHAFHQQVTAWVESASPMPAEPVFLIAEGAIVTASTTGDASAARSARTAVEALIG
ncbi:MAG TPA: TetR/AcrR family transcriptional regulator, partial [Nocardioides sp.]